jgi:rhodanese-related sulfurtransferase
MNDIILFLVHHYILSTLFILLLIVVIYIETAGSTPKGVKKISPAEAIHFMNRENALIIDLRDSTAYKVGHIAKAVSISPGELLEHKKLAGKEDQAIILVCENGMKSSTSARQLSQKGFLKVFYISGGMNTWTNENLPIVK